jgi:alpha-L-arabinofuranosidase
LASGDLNAENSFDHPTNVAPASSTFAVTSQSIPVSLPPHSVNVYRMRAR